MLKIYAVLVSLIVLPIVAYSIGMRTLTTELKFIKNNALEIDAKRKELSPIGERVPPLGSVRENAPPKRLDPRPVCDYASRRSNVQKLDVSTLKTLDANHTAYRPTDYSSVLYSVLMRNMSDSSVHRRIWGYEEMLRQALETRYLLVHQYSMRRDPGETKIEFTEAFLFDLATGQIVDSFRYPAGPPLDLDAKGRFLSARWETTIDPRIPISTDPQTNDVDLVTFLLVAWCIVTGLFALLSLPAALKIAKDQRVGAERKARGDYPETLPCLCCGEDTDGLRQLRLPAIIVFLGLVWVMRLETVIACRACMRSSIFWSFLANLPLGNIVMIVLAPWLLFHWLHTFQKGHSSELITTENTENTEGAYR